MLRRSIFVAGVLGAVVLAQEPGRPVAPGAPVEPPRVEAIAAAVDTMLDGLGRAPAGLVVLRGQEVVHQSLHRGLLADEPMPIASASKWLAVATVLAVVDEGLLDLDAPIGRYVVELDRPDKRAVTLRQCLSCSAGWPSRLPGNQRDWDSAKFAAVAADASLRDAPGTAFRYGGVTFQIAAIAAERVTGKDWHTLFAERIGGPLGMAATKFAAMQPFGADPGTTKLPGVAGAAVSTLADYTRFVQMLLAEGEFGGRRVLTRESVAALLRDQVPEPVLVRTPNDYGEAFAGVRYGFGSWLVRPEGTWLRACDPGAFGFTPWLDLDLGIGGVLAIRDRAPRVLPRLAAVQAVVREVLQEPAQKGESVVIELEHGGRTRRFSLFVPAKPQLGPQGVGAALVVVLHGGGGNGEQVAATTRFAELAAREGFVVAFPDGTGPLRGRLLTWNAGGIKVYASEQGVDDVGFLREVVRTVQRRTAIDPQRVFAVGHSNGAMLCHRLAREAADVFAGFAAVAGAMNFTAVDSATPIAALLIHGTADRHVRIEGGVPEVAIGKAGDRQDASLQAAIDYYVRRNGCAAEAKRSVEGKVVVDEYAPAAGGGAPVRVVQLEGGGHAWPGAAERTTRRADQPFPWDATAAIWAFFAALPGAAAGR